MHFIRPAVAGLMLLLAASSHAAPSVMVMVNKEGCLGCHAHATKLVGPAYDDVVAKYKGQSDAADLLASSIIKGSTGKWGDAAMPPHPDLSKADAQAARRLGTERRETVVR